MRPSTSQISPQQYSPGQRREARRLTSSSRSGTPPAVVSAQVNPRSPVTGATHRSTVVTSACRSVRVSCAPVRARGTAASSSRSCARRSGRCSPKNRRTVCPPQRQQLLLKPARRQFRQPVDDKLCRQPFLPRRQPMPTDVERRRARQSEMRTQQRPGNGRQRPASNPDGHGGRRTDATPVTQRMVWRRAAAGRAPETSA
jgi:hypothetical protein